MLRILRNKKTAKKIWIILAVLIVPAFVLWGFGGALKSGQQSNYAGKMFGRNVPIQDYNEALSAVRNMALIQFGKDFSEVQKYLNLEYQAWDRLMLLHEAKKRKIKASDMEVIEQIEKYPFFQKGEKFDSQTYSQMLKYVFYTAPRVFEEQTRQNIILSKLYRELTDKIKVDEDEAKEEYRKDNEEISVYYIAGIPGDFLKDIKPSEEEIKGYFSQNSFKFKQPISFNMDFMVIDSVDKIKEIMPHLSSKKDFNNVAQELNIEVKETGFFGQTDPIPGIGWSAEILDLISKLKVGEYTPPIQTDKAFYILKLKERKESYIPEFEKIKEKVKESYVKDAAEKIAKEKVENCLEKVDKLTRENAKLVDFAKLAKEFNLKYGSTELFKYGSYVEGIGASDELWRVASDLKDNQVSGLVEVSSGSYIIKIKSQVPMDEKKFESEKADFTQKLLFEKKEKIFAAFLEELRKRAQGL